jgi:hypothetical protein
MTTTITDYIRVADKASELGCKIPTGIAILPENFSTAVDRQHLLLGSQAATIQKLFRNNNFPMDDLLPAEERAPSIHNKHFEWAPLLFISAGLLSSDPNAVSVALGIISNYATDFFKGMPSKKIKLNIVVEKKKDRACKQLSYEGDIAGLASLPEIIRGINDG